MLIADRTFGKFRGIKIGTSEELRSPGGQRQQLSSGRPAIGYLLRLWGTPKHSALTHPSIAKRIQHPSLKTVLLPVMLQS